MRHTHLTWLVGGLLWISASLCAASEEVQLHAAHRPPRRLPTVLDCVVLPTLTMGTDDRYDTVNNRERARQIEIDELAARHHGDPLWRRSPVLDLLRPPRRAAPTDPGFALARAIQLELHGLRGLPPRSP